MARRFFRGFKIRIPRKLKKAAKYGVERHVNPTKIRIYMRDYKFVYEENVEYVIVGRRTNGKQGHVLLSLKKIRDALLIHGMSNTTE